MQIACKYNYFSYLCRCERDGGRQVSVFYYMDKTKFINVVERSAKERGCEVVDIMYNDDDNVFEVTIDRKDSPVDLQDCEHVHRAVLSAFDRDVEDYALTVGSVGIGSEEADEILKSMNEEQ